MRQLVPDAVDVSDAVTVRIAEGSRPDLINYGVLIVKYRLSPGCRMHGKTVDGTEAAADDMRQLTDIIRAGQTVV